jgi:hypothetical protein
VCGFGFGRNLTKLDYPVEEAIRSVLPLCDQFVFAVGKSDDDTRRRVERIDPKVSIVDTVWPDVKADGAVLAIEANKAMVAAQATGCTWGFYIQADEVIHEDDLPRIRAAMQYWAGNPEVKALLFRYLHFYLDYQSIDPWCYHKACRVIRLDNSCEIVADACGPAIKDYTDRGARPTRRGSSGYLDRHHLGGHVRWARDPQRSCAPAARVYHYGAVKTPQHLASKLDVIEELWWGDLPKAERERTMRERFPDPGRRHPILKRFRGSHPAVMTQRIASHPVLPRTRSRWLRLEFYREVLRHGFKG